MKTSFTQTLIAAGFFGFFGIAQAALTDNSLTTNALTSNALTENALTDNGLSMSNGLSTNGWGNGLKSGNGWTNGLETQNAADLAGCSDSRSADKAAAQVRPCTLRPTLKSLSQRALAK
jgi:hypothetical protein